MQPSPTRAPQGRPTGVRSRFMSTRATFKRVLWSTPPTRWRHSGTFLTAPSCPIARCNTAGRFLDQPELRRLQQRYRLLQTLNAHSLGGRDRGSVLRASGFDPLGLGGGTGVPAYASCLLAGELPLRPGARG